MAVVYESTSLLVALGSTAVVFVWRVVTFRYVLRYERSNIVFEYRVLVDTEYCAALNTSSIQDHTDYQVHGLASHTEYSRYLHYSPGYRSISFGGFTYCKVSRCGL